MRIAINEFNFGVTTVPVVSRHFWDSWRGRWISNMQHRNTSLCVTLSRLVPGFRNEI